MMHPTPANGKTTAHNTSLSGHEHLDHGVIILIIYIILVILILIIIAVIIIITIIIIITTARRKTKTQKKENKEIAVKKIQKNVAWKPICCCELCICACDLGARNGTERRLAWLVWQDDAKWMHKLRSQEDHTNLKMNRALLGTREKKEIAVQFMDEQDDHEKSWIQRCESVGSCWLRCAACPHEIDVDAIDQLWNFSVRWAHGGRWSWT